MKKMTNKTLHYTLCKNKTLISSFKFPCNTHSSGSLLRQNCKWQYRALTDPFWYKCRAFAWLLFRTITGPLVDTFSVQLKGIWLTPFQYKYRGYTSSVQIKDRPSYWLPFHTSTLIWVQVLGFWLIPFQYRYIRHKYRGLWFLSKSQKTRPFIDSLSVQVHSYR